MWLFLTQYHHVWLISGPKFVPDVANKSRTRFWTICFRKCHARRESEINDFHKFLRRFQRGTTKRANPTREKKAQSRKPTNIIRSRFYGPIRARINNPFTFHIRNQSENVNARFLESGSVVCFWGSPESGCKELGCPDTIFKAFWKIRAEFRETPFAKVWHNRSDSKLPRRVFSNRDHRLDDLTPESQVARIMDMLTSY